jgi:AraC family transcriptional regulator of adaptative response / DNA-3-methyladenine glycosylase II
MTADADDTFYQAMLARDPRFDGKFFVGVKTTGVYCRPICPAKPKRRNVEFFPHARAAERAGYRPCLRCRPECAPESPAWFGTSAVVRRALKLIAANELHAGDEDDFASQLGVTPRHLRRLFATEVGQTPKRIADNNRLDFARKLVVETSLPMTDVALTSGFASLRRFNAAFKTRFRRPPTGLRRSAPAADPSRGVDLSLAYRPPLDWQSLLSFYRTHRIDGLQSVTGDTFERLFRLAGTTGVVRVAPAPAGVPRLYLRVITGNPAVLSDVVRRVRRMFDLDADPVLVANAFSRVPTLSRLCGRTPGLRVARGWDPFETAVCTILGQLVSIDRASALTSELVTAYGEPIPHPITGGPARLFPTPETLATSDLTAVKTTGARKQTIREFSRRVAAGELSLSDAQDPAAFRAALRSIKGVGAWSAEYISLRAIGDTDAFPATDLILARALGFHPDLDLSLVQPWRAYAAIYLWREFAKTLSRTKVSVP